MTIKRFTREEFLETVYNLTAKAADFASKDGNETLAVSITVAGAAISVALERGLFDSDDEIEIVKE